MNLLKTSIVAATLLAFTFPSVALDLGQSDCTKTPAYLADVAKQGFSPLITFTDRLDPTIEHTFAYSEKTREILVTSIKDKTKICVDYIGAEATVSSPDKFRKFLDDNFENNPKS